MKSFIFVSAALATAGLTGQQSREGVRPETPTFVWTAESAQELGLKEELKLSKTLTPSDRNGLIEAIASILRPKMHDLDIGSETELRKIAADTRVKLIDINDDGIPEIIAQATGIEAGRGATGNCPFWVFSKRAFGYELLIRVSTYAQVFEVESSKTNGYRDLVIGTHDSATEQTLLIYRYAKGRYLRGACYDANYQRFDSRGWHRQKPDHHSLP